MFLLQTTHIVNTLVISLFKVVKLTVNEFLITKFSHIAEELKTTQHKTYMLKDFFISCR